MQSTQKGMRIHIAIFGRRNTGKSSLLNALTQQDVSIVSNIAGTTTDPVEKAMELLPIGPVLFIDTAGLDDVGKLGELRINKTYKVLDRADIVLLVTEANTWGEYEERVVLEAKDRDTPILVVFNKTDLFKTDPVIRKILTERMISHIEICALQRGWEVVDTIKNQIVRLLPDSLLQPRPIIADLVESDDVVVLVIPVDKEAPKGRIILPQQQTLRELLDRDIVTIISNEKNLVAAISNSVRKPKVVITDSQAFRKVFATIPSDIMVTSFSILFARAKGDLTEYVKGAQAIDSLKGGDRVLIAEACTHHPIGEDIGRVKIPRWINRRVNGEVEFTVYSGHDFPEDLETYKLIIHCGSCMFNRKETLNRVFEAKRQNIPFTNYGVAIAYLNDNLERALEIFQSPTDRLFSNPERLLETAKMSHSSK